MGFGQFFPHISPLQEQADGPRACESMGIRQQPRQGSTGAGSNDVEYLGRCVLHPGIDHPDIQFHPRGRGGQEGTFLGGSLEQGDLEPVPQHRRQHQARKPGPRTHIGQSHIASSRSSGNMAGQLGAVPEMTSPQIVQAPPGNQVVAAVPVHQHVGIGLQARQCFT